MPVNAEKVQAAYNQLSGLPKDIFYYIIFGRNGRASFIDLIGHTRNVNAILAVLDITMTEVDSGGFTITQEYVEEFKKLFKADTTYQVPAFTRSPIF